MSCNCNGNCSSNNSHSRRDFLLTSLLATATALFTATNASAWSQEVHRRIAIDAVNYMKAN